MKWRSASNIQCKIDGGVGHFLYVPLRIFGCLWTGFWEPNCCKRFQTVAETELAAEIVADGFKLLQSVAKPFLLRIREDRDRKIFVPKLLRHSLTKYGDLSRIDQIEKPGPQIMAGAAKFLVRKTLPPFPYLLRGVLCRSGAFFQVITKFYRPATPSPFPL
jgi:hypothetical protein